MEENRIIDFVELLSSHGFKSWEEITKQLRKHFDCKFRLNETECQYLTRYYKGELNFDTPILNMNGKRIN